MREIVHVQAGQCGNQIGSKVISSIFGGNVFCHKSCDREKRGKDGVHRCWASAFNKPENNFLNKIRQRLKFLKLSQKRLNDGAKLSASSIHILDACL